MVDISVIMPAKDAAAFIGEAIRSVQAQTLACWELIVIDDASTDDTRARVEALARADARIRLLALPSRQGPARARNHGIRQARGRYIAFLDSDDCWYPIKLERQIAALSHSRAALVYSHYHVRHDATESPVRLVRCPTRLDYADLLRGDPIGCLTVTWDRQRTGTILMPDLYMRQDWGLWLRILARGHHGIGVQEALASLRLHRKSLSQNKWRAMYYNYLVLRKEGRRSRMGALSGSLTHALHAVQRRIMSW
jgi:teichuronic acid biosynthesis glycosyltransferase TuaG